MSLPVQLYCEAVFGDSFGNVTSRSVTERFVWAGREMRGANDSLNDLFERIFLLNEPEWIRLLK